MRRLYRNKRRSCALCKPHKRGRARRFKPAEQALLHEAERLIRNL